MAAVYKYNGLLKASISSATNGHRLGANEAPPAIISIFMGKQISEVLEKLAESTSDDVLNMSGKSGLKLDVAQIPEILMDRSASMYCRSSPRTPPTATELRPLLSQAIVLNSEPSALRRIALRQ